MTKQDTKRAKVELSRALGTGRGLLFTSGGFSFFVNILMLTGPLFMLQVYDRVLASQSIPTLVALTILVVVLYGGMGILDFLRGRVLARVGARFQSVLDTRVFRGVLRQSLVPQNRQHANTSLRDLESIQQFLSGPAPLALFDLPWVPIYLLAIYMFHWQLGALATFAALFLLVVVVINELMTRGPEEKARMAAAEGERLGESLRRNSELIQAMGMLDTALGRWGGKRKEALSTQIVHSDRAGLFQTTTKTTRLFLQSAILALGAYHAVLGAISPGAMIAASILMGRALAPIDQTVAQWRNFLRARRGYSNIKKLLTAIPVPTAKMALGRPSGQLAIRGLAVAPLGAKMPTIRGINFTLEPGEALGVIGPSGSGKSTLARAILGIWPPVAGEVRLDGALLSQWDPEELGQYFGYLPQDVALFEGTVAQNISRLQDQPDSEAVRTAAQAAEAEQMINELPDGYNTQIGEAGAQLSGGQRQRIGLARALYGRPPILILDEPNAHLDHQGEVSLVHAILRAKEAGQTVIIIAHRPNAVAACDKLLMLQNGLQQEFGPREEVLQKVTKNRAKLARINPERANG